MEAILEVPMWAIFLSSLISFVLGIFICSWHNFLATRVLEIIEACEGCPNSKVADHLDTLLAGWGGEEPKSRAVRALVKRLRKL